MTVANLNSTQNSPGALPTRTSVIIFDYGNVLDIAVDNPAWLAHRDTVAAPYGLTGEALWTQLYYTDPWQKAKRGQISEDEFWEAVLGPLGISARPAQDAFMARLLKGRDKVHPDMEKLLRELRPHYRLAILSNTQLVEMETWLANVQGLKGIFDVVISSAKAKLAKPDVEIYELAVKLLNVPPQEILFIDDLIRNTSVAETVGIQCIVFESPEQLRRELAARGIWPLPGSPDTR